MNLAFSTVMFWAPAQNRPLALLFVEQRLPIKTSPRLPLVSPGIKRKRLCVLVGPSQRHGENTRSWMRISISRLEDLEDVSLGV